MTPFASFHRIGLVAALLFVGIGSALHAQTSTNPDVTNSRLELDTPTADRVLLQNSVDNRIVLPSPETLLGHRLLLEMGTRNAITQGVTENYLNAAGKVGFPAKHGAAVTHRYFVTDLGTLGGTQSFAYAINDSGEVVGLSLTPGDASDHSFLYSHGRINDLYPLNSQNILTVGPTGINNSGQIASGTIVGSVYFPAIFDSRTADLAVLGSLGGVTSYGFNGVATSINNRGDAVGYSYIDAVNRHAFLYSKGVMTDIHSVGGYSVAFAINDEGVIVGFESDPSDVSEHAFVYSQGIMTDIFPVGTESYARGINNHGQVVGEFLIADQSAFHAFLYSEGMITDLGSAQSPETVASAINDRQQVIGTTYVPYDTICSGIPCVQYTPHAFFYEGGNMSDLNTLIPSDSGWVLSWGIDTNNHGQIVGYGLVNNKFRAFLLTPAISKEQCKEGGWETFGFKNQGQCIQFVNTSK